MSAVVPAGTASNPFPGLRPFREDEEQLFFGREAQVDVMVDTLAATRFLAVVGTSGSGKSSLVNCGLVPALHRGLLASAGSGWRIATLRPGNRPIHALAEALARPGVLPQPAAEASGFTPAELVEATLGMGKRGLLEAYREARPADARRNLLVVVDQFEELFRYRSLSAAPGDEAGSAPSEHATAFVNLLLEVAAQRELPVYVVLTMRSDFLGDCAQFFGLPEAINRGQYLVPRMTRDERRAAIVGPLRVCGAGVDPVLLTQLVNDVGDNPDQLSILQHALNRTWARWRADGATGPLALAHYQAVGTMAHALNQHAEEAFAELAEGRPRALCEALFKAITDKGSDARGTRRPTRLDTLCEITGAGADELEAVMAGFRDPSRAFLMPPAGVALAPDVPIDISHESLMRVWDRLRGWTDDEAQSAQTYRRLAETAELYPKRANLIGPPELQVALAWRERRRPNAAWARRYRAGFDAAMAFLDASAEADEAARRADAARREEAARLRQAQARAKQNRVWMAIVLPLSIGAAAGMAWLAWQARVEKLAADQERDAAKVQAAEAVRQAEQIRQEKARAEAALAELRRLEVSQQAQAQVLERVKEAAPQLLTTIQKATQGQSLVYLQYADDRQKALIERLRAQLGEAGYSAPGSEKVAAVPSGSELRYFRADDATEAARLAGQLRQWGVVDLSVKLVRGYEGRLQVRQFELWLARPADDDLARLAQSLNAGSKDERLAAGQTLQSRYTGSPQAIEAVLGLLDAGRIGSLSAEGRINALYFLSRTDPAVWTPALVQRGRAAVTRIEERDKSGAAALGPQTRAELNRFIAVLDAVRPGSRSVPEG